MQKQNNSGAEKPQKKQRIHITLSKNDVQGQGWSMVCFHFHNLKHLQYEHFVQNKIMELQLTMWTRASC